MVILCFGVTDWFDGLHTFTSNICHRSWLGGWFMPQKTSYFALQLPMGWWIFGLDLALHNDIDFYQFDFFSKLAKKKVSFLYLYFHCFDFQYVYQIIKLNYVCFKRFFFFFGKILFWSLNFTKYLFGLRILRVSISAFWYFFLFFPAHEQ